MAPRNKIRWLLTGAAIVPLAAAVAAWFWARPILSSDTATGLAAYRNWAQGGPWNCVVAPAASDLARDAPSYVSWWSPGQAAWPGVFMLGGGSVGVALILSALVGAWVKSAGLYLLAQRLGLTPAAAAGATLLEALSWHALYPFGMYIGGEVAQAAWLPWMLLGAWALRKRPRWWLPVLPVLFFLGVFAKLTMEVTAAATTAWLWSLSVAETLGNRRRWFARGVLLVAAFAVAMLLVRTVLVRGGPTPAMLVGTRQNLLAALSFSLCAPLLAATGAASIIGRMAFLHSVSFAEAWTRLVPLAIPIAIVVTAGYGVVVARLRQRPLAHLLAWVIAAHVAAMAVLLVSGGAVSFEDRHFRAAGMLLIVALVALAAETRTAAWLRRTASGIVALGALIGVGATAQRAVRLARIDRVGGAGFTQPDLDGAAAAKLHHLGQEYGRLGGVIYLPSPPLRFEVSHTRVIATDAMTRDMAWLRAQCYRGQVPVLTVLAPRAWSGSDRLAALLASFTGYPQDRWRCEVTGEWLFCTAGMNANPP